MIFLQYHVKILRKITSTLYGALPLTKILQSISFYFDEKLKIYDSPIPVLLRKAIYKLVGVPDFWEGQLEKHI